MNVLIGIDGSQGSHTAVAFVARLLAEGDRVAFYCTPLKVTMRGGEEVDAEVQAKADAAMVDVLFGDAKEKLPDGLQGEVETFTSDQPPAKQLAEIADQWGADLVVVGSRGLTGFKSMILGSVARGIAKQSRVPVLIVRPYTDPTPERLDILFAFQDDLAGRRAADVVRTLRWPENTRARLFTVIDPMQPAEVPAWLESSIDRDEETEQYVAAWQDEHDQDREQELKKLHDLHAGLPPCFGEHEPIVAEGLPREEILRTVQDEQTDLLILGAHTKSWWRWLSEGSVSQQVIDQAACSVLVVPEGETR